jgi:hypothetical protein
MQPVTLQINLTASDARLATSLLPHQLRQCGEHVDEVLLTLDLRGVERPYFPWEANGGDNEVLCDVVAEAQRNYRNVRAIEVDHSSSAATAVKDALFNGRNIPRHDYRQRPFYSYFFGLWAASNDYILHLDADMFCGGGSASWYREAVAVLDRPDVFSCSPFPGPPTDGFELHTQVGHPVSGIRAGYAFDSFSTRVFFLDRRVLGRWRPPRACRPSALDIARGALHGRGVAPAPEHVFSKYMRAAGLRRLDFLGEPPGLWTLHPPYRSERFYAMLPDIVQMVEEDGLPDGQRGDYDLNDSVLDWSDAHALLHASRWRR